MSGFDYGNYGKKAEGTVYQPQGKKAELKSAATENKSTEALFNFKQKSVEANSLDAYANYAIGGLNVGKKVDLGALNGVLTADQVAMVAKFVKQAQQERIIAGVQARTDVYENNFLA